MCTVQVRGYQCDYSISVQALSCSIQGMIEAQIAPKNIINQAGNREVEDRLERKIEAEINFITTPKW